MSLVEKFELDDRQDRERMKAVDLAVGQIEKQFGKGSIMRLGQKGAIQPIDAIPTGAISIDHALGVGGVPRGRVVEVLIRSGGVDVVVVDSVAALVPKAEIEGEMGDAQMGLQARLMSQALRKLTGAVSKSKTSLIFINQLREKIGVMFGNPETTTGGRALKFYSSVRIDIRRIASIKDGDIVTGSRTKVKVVKNKVAAPFREAEFDILYGEGISREGDLLDIAANNNILEKSGSWYSYKGERIGQGRENARQFLKDNKDVMARLETEVRKALGLITAQPAVQGAVQAAGQGTAPGARVTAISTGTEGKPAPGRR